VTPMDWRAKAELQACETKVDTRAQQTTAEPVGLRTYSRWFWRKGGVQRSRGVGETRCRWKPRSLWNNQRDDWPRWSRKDKWSLRDDRAL